MRIFLCLLFLSLISSEVSSYDCIDKDSNSTFSCPESGDSNQAVFCCDADDDDPIRRCCVTAFDDDVDGFSEIQVSILPTFYLLAPLHA